MKTRTGGRTKDEALLTSMAGSIGSTLGSIVGRAHAVQKALSGSRVSRTVKSDGRKLVKKSKSAGRKTSRRGSRRTASSAGRGTRKVQGLGRSRVVD